MPRRSSSSARNVSASAFGSAATVVGSASTSPTARSAGDDETSARAARRRPCTAARASITDDQGGGADASRHPSIVGLGAAPRGRRSLRGTTGRMPPLTLGSPIIEIDARVAKRQVRSAKKGGPAHEVLAASSFEIQTVGDLLHHYPRRYIDRSRVSTIVGCDARHLRHRDRGRAEGAQAHDAQASDDGDGHDPRPDRLPRPHVLQPAVDGVRIYREGMEVAVSGVATLYKGRLQLAKQEVELLRGDEADLVHTGRITPVHPATDGITTRTIRELVHRAIERLGPIADPLPDDIVRAEGLGSYDRSLRDIHFPADEAALEAARERLKFDELFTLELGVAYRKQRVEVDSAGVAHETDGPLARRLLETIPFEPTDAQSRAMGEIGAAMARPRPMNVLLQGDVGRRQDARRRARGPRGDRLRASGRDHGADRGARGPALPLGGRAARRDRRHAVPGVRGVAASRPRGGADLAARCDRARRRWGTTRRRTTGRHRDVRAADRRGHGQRPPAHRRGGRRRQPRPRRRHARARAGVGDLRRPEPRGGRRAAPVRPAPANRLAAQGRRGRRAHHDRDPDPAHARPHVLRRPRRRRARRAADGAPADRRRSPRARPPSGRRPTSSCAARSWPGARRSWSAPRSTRATERRSRPPRPRRSGWPPRSSRNCGSSCCTGACARRRSRRSWTGSSRATPTCSISTTVIEVGVDVPNATVMLVENAERFGLAQLHQLRGRIGRGEHAGTCVLFDESDEDNLEARARIEAMVRTTDGFELADEDLRLRGEGTLFDTKQSGMPDLRLARLAEDMPLVARARSRAFALIDDDPRARRASRAARRAATSVRAVDRLAVPLLMRIVAGSAKGVRLGPVPPAVRPDLRSSPRGAVLEPRSRRARGSAGARPVRGHGRGGHRGALARGRTGGVRRPRAGGRGGDPAQPGRHQARRPVARSSRRPWPGSWAGTTGPAPPTTW